MFPGGIVGAGSGDLLGPPPLLDVGRPRGGPKRSAGPSSVIAHNPLDPIRRVVRVMSEHNRIDRVIRLRVPFVENEIGFRAHMHDEILRFPGIRIDAPIIVIGIRRAGPARPKRPLASRRKRKRKWRRQRRPDLAIPDEIIVAHPALLTICRLEP